jgi:hypothetical protein
MMCLSVLYLRVVLAVALTAQWKIPSIVKIGSQTSGLDL